MIWPAAIFFTVTLLANLIADYSTFLKGKTVQHGKGLWFILRLIGCSISVTFLAFPEREFYWLSLVSGGFMVFFAWWLIFDGIWGLLLNLGFFYAGTTARMDRWIGKYPIWGRALIKIGGLALLTVLYFVSR